MGLRAAKEPCAGWSGSASCIRPATDGAADYLVPTISPPRGAIWPSDAPRKDWSPSTMLPDRLAHLDELLDILVDAFIARAQAEESAQRDGQIESARPSEVPSARSEP